MALARLIGCVQLVVARLWMYRCAMSNWGIAIFNCRSVRAESLVAAVVPADESLCRRVWLRLVGSFAEYTINNMWPHMVVEQIAGIEAAVMSVCAEEYVPESVHSRRAAEEYAKVGILVEEAVSAEACRRAASCKAGSGRGLERKSGCSSR